MPLILVYVSFWHDLNLVHVSIYQSVAPSNHMNNINEDSSQLHRRCLLANTNPLSVNLAQSSQSLADLRAYSLLLSLSVSQQRFTSGIIGAILFCLGQVCNAVSRLLWTCISFSSIKTNPMKLLAFSAGLLEGPAENLLIVLFQGMR